MLERSSVGYKGLIPRISYSRYFSIDNTASSEKFPQETKRFSNHSFCAGESRQNSANYDKIKPRRVSTIELKNKGVSIAESKADTGGKKYLLPPPQKFKANSMKKSTRAKLQTDCIGADFESRGQVASACSECNEISSQSGRCVLCLKLYNDYQATEYQQMKCKRSDTRPISANSTYQVTDEEMQREKIINSWMQFFG